MNFLETISRRNIHVADNNVRSINLTASAATVIDVILLKLLWLRDLSPKNQTKPHGNLHLTFD